MTDYTIEQALETIYTSLQNNNKDIDTAMAPSGKKEIEVDPARLVQNNRQGRKMMQSYFKKRGIIVTFLS